MDPGSLFSLGFVIGLTPFFILAYRTPSAPFQARRDRGAGGCPELQHEKEEDRMARARRKISGKAGKKGNGLLTAKQAACILDCSPDDVLAYRRKGLIRGQKHGTRYWRFRRKDVERLSRTIRRPA